MNGGRIIKCSLIGKDFFVFLAWQFQAQTWRGDMATAFQMATTCPKCGEKFEDVQYGKLPCAACDPETYAALRPVMSSSQLMNATTVGQFMAGRYVWRFFTEGETAARTAPVHVILHGGWSEERPSGCYDFVYVTVCLTSELEGYAFDTGSDIPDDRPRCPRCFPEAYRESPLA